MQIQSLKKLGLPDEPGVYIFRDYKGRPLYIGRATSLRDRVKSYFSIDLIKTRGPRIVDMIVKSKKLTWQKTDSVLEAILLESNLIKKYQTFYNVDERDDKSDQYVVITDEEWPRVFLVRARDFLESKLKGELPYRVKKIFGPYPYSGVIKESLRILRKMFPFKDGKSNDPRHERFYRSIGRSPQQGDNHDAAMKGKYFETIKYLIMFFEGKKGTLKKQLTSKMRADAKAMRFEEAEETKRLLYAIDHINDISLIKQETISSSGLDSDADFRIEAYDIAHLSGTNVVGAMVVSVNGERAPSEYRKFKISKQKNDDARALAEVFLRRFNHAEWRYPNLIVVDGNEIQLNAATSILKSRRIDIPIVAVTKDAKHKADRIIGHEKIVKLYRTDIVRINTEAHRFVIAYHRQKRGKLI